MVDIDALKHKAEAGDPEAQCRLAAYLATGDSTMKDEAEAARWYRSAAEQGHVEAQWNLGWMYVYGEALPKDERTGVKWIEQAAAGYVDAANAMAEFYDQGLYGLPRDAPKAMEWRQRAIELAGKNGNSDSG